MSILNVEVCSITMGIHLTHMQFLALAAVNYDKELIPAMEKAGADPCSVFLDSTGSRVLFTCESTAAGVDIARALQDLVGG